jgi:3'-phosphoadenosine 5'-phosphosulfate sulfotransferase (PAPS reductase)/FAD synthetase
LAVSRVVARPPPGSGRAAAPLPPPRRRPWLVNRARLAGRRTDGVRVSQSAVLDIKADDERMQLRDGESLQTRMVRFRTLGCYPLTGALESEAANLDEIIHEMRHSRVSERQGRVIDHDGSASMELKKQEGYF